MSRITFILTIFLTGSVSCLTAAPTQWTTGPGANDHFYEVRLFPSPSMTPVGGQWEDANDAAVAAIHLGNPGYLATIESAEENAFVFGLADAPEFWQLGPVNDDNFGPWLGGFQPDGFPEPDQGWRWVPPTDVPFDFTAWAAGEPNNFPAGGGGLGTPNDESRLHFFGKLGAREPTWNDLSHDLDLDEAPIGYVVEWVPEPATHTSLSTLCLVGVGVLCWRRRIRCL